MKIKRHQLRKILHEVLNADLHDEIVLSVTDTVLDTAMGNVGSDRMNVVLAGLDNEMERREMEEEEVNFADIELEKIVSDILKNIDEAEKEAKLSLDDDEDERRGLMSEMSLLQLLEVDTDGSGDLSPDELRDIADDLEGSSEFAETDATQENPDYIVTVTASDGEEISLHKDMSGLETGWAVIENPGLYRGEPDHPFHNLDWKMKDGETVIGVPRDWDGPGGEVMTVADAYQEHSAQMAIDRAEHDDWMEDRHYEDQSWKDTDPEYIARGKAIEAEYEAEKAHHAEEQDLERMLTPEEGEDQPRQMGMGRRPLIGPARDVRRGRKISESKNLSRSEIKNFFRMLMEDSPVGDGLISVETALQEKLVAAGVPESWVIEVVNKLQNTTSLNAMQVAQLDSQSDLLSQELQTIEDKWSKSVDTNWATWKTDSVPVEVVDQVATLVKEKIDTR